MVEQTARQETTVHSAIMHDSARHRDLRRTGDLSVMCYEVSDYVRDHRLKRRGKVTMCLCERSVGAFLSERDAAFRERPRSRRFADKRIPSPPIERT